MPSRGRFPFILQERRKARSGTAARAAPPEGLLHAVGTRRTHATPNRGLRRFYERCLVFSDTYLVKRLYRLRLTRSL